MKKALITASAALLIGGMAPAIALAQSAEKPAVEQNERGEQREVRAPRLTAEDREAFASARLTAAKAALELNADQEKLWSDLEKTLSELRQERAKKFAEWREKRREGERPSFAESLENRATALETRAASLKKIAAAAKPLTDSFNDTQNRRFGVLIHEYLGDKAPKHHAGPARGGPHGR